MGELLEASEAGRQQGCPQGGRGLGGCGGELIIPKKHQEVGGSAWGGGAGGQDVTIWPLSGEGIADRA